MGWLYAWKLWLTHNCWSFLLSLCLVYMAYSIFFYPASQKRLSYSRNRFRSILWITNLNPIHYKAYYSKSSVLGWENRAIPTILLKWFLGQDTYVYIVIWYIFSYLCQWWLTFARLNAQSTLVCMGLLQNAMHMQLPACTPPPVHACMPPAYVPPPTHAPGDLKTI